MGRGKPGVDSTPSKLRGGRTLRAVLVGMLREDTAVGKRPG